MHAIRSRMCIPTCSTEHQRRCDLAWYPARAGLVHSGQCAFTQCALETIEQGADKGRSIFGPHALVLTMPLGLGSFQLARVEARDPLCQYAHVNCAAHAHCLSTGMWIRVPSLAPDRTNHMQYVPPLRCVSTGLNHPFN